jgi:hypothetical protein
MMSFRCWILFASVFSKTMLVASFRRLSAFDTYLQQYRHTCSTTAAEKSSLRCAIPPQQYICHGRAGKLAVDANSHDGFFPSPAHMQEITKIKWI